MESVPASRTFKRMCFVHVNFFKKILNSAPGFVAVYDVDASVSAAENKREENRFYNALLKNFVIRKISVDVVPLHHVGNNIFIF